MGRARAMSKVQVMEGFGFAVEVVRTDRRKKTIAIELDGELVRVRAPRRLSDSRLRDLVIERTPWIEARLREQAERPEVKPKEYVSGETFSYLGRNYRLKVIAGESHPVRLKQGYLVVLAPEGEGQQREVKGRLESWYRANAEELLRDKTERMAKLIEVAPRSVSVRNYKSRWGSCSSSGDITYNWKIIMAPHHIVDYVVVHELCHLLEHNHSPRYWRHVARFIPDWKERRDWLKHNPLIV